MTEQQAYKCADWLERHPCMHVVMVANGVGLLKERGIPVPAWTIPNLSWLVLWRHDGYEGVNITNTHGDEQVANLLREQGYVQKRNGRRTTKTAWINPHEGWRCPDHEREGGAA